MLIWQLLQVRHAYDTPLVLVGPMWKDLVAWAQKHMADRGMMLARPEDLRIPTCVDAVDQAVEGTRRHAIPRERAHVERRAGNAHSLALMRTASFIFVESEELAGYCSGVHQID